MFARTALIDLRNAALVVGLLALLSLLAAACAPADGSVPPAARRPHVTAIDAVAAGEYLIRVGSCDDCHTPGWGESGGSIPDSLRLMGGALGFRGPWGTSYPANLRLSVQHKNATQWIAAIRSRQGLPPMPWFTLHHMSEQDLAAIHAYLASLGAKGQPAPAALPPGVVPTTPYIPFMPVFPEEVSE
ncbi:MAG TPA: hypothetical protein PLL69_11760 [Gemmatimonadales bacterium]|nr:hypothetical protein [Gemmatimonadales bacterium]